MTNSLMFYVVVLSLQPNVSLKWGLDINAKCSVLNTQGCIKKIKIELC